MRLNKGTATNHLHALNKLKVIGLLLVISLVVAAYTTQEKPQASPPVKIGFIGDSITEAVYLKTTPVDAAVEALGSNYIGINRGVGGSTTHDWLPEGEMYKSAAAAFKAQGVHTASIMLGTNDARNDVSAPPEQYGKNMKRIIAALLASGSIHQIILNVPPYAVPSEEGMWNKKALARLEGYMAEINGLAHERGVLLGDTKAYGYFMRHTGELKDGIHPTQQGALQLGNLWADAYRRALKTASRDNRLAMLGIEKGMLPAWQRRDKPAMHSFSAYRFAFSKDS